MKVKAEYHYTRTDGIVTYCEGVLTDEHALSSYGLPVFLAGSNYRTKGEEIAEGQVYGYGDLPTGEMVITGHITGMTGAEVMQWTHQYNTTVAGDYDNPVV